MFSCPACTEKLNWLVIQPLIAFYLEETLTVALLVRVSITLCEHPVDPALHDGRNTEPVHGELEKKKKVNTSMQKH